ncbi:uncharacterized protein LOC115967010 [Quercus lobata]|uniref:uncharacterized protein LOC115967010 n=1 Tax=Quercus lobata TaxID=97700 RepID=UPI0012466E38|nr:uncharacterized protein LOC115967010 [Quercus lobata]
MWYVDHVSLGNRRKLSIQALRSTTSRPLELLHLDLIGPTRTESLGGKRYIMVVVDDFTRYTWVILLRSKFDAPKHIEALCTRLQNEKNLKIDRIRSDHGKEFENSPSTKKTPYELWKGRKPNVKYFRIFRSTCFILKDRENVGKFDSRSDEDIFLGYSSTSKAYRVYNKRIMKVMETMTIIIDESSDSDLKKGIEEFPKEILPLKPKEVQEIVEQEPTSPSAPGTPIVVEDFADIPTSPNSESHEEKGPSSRVKPTKVEEALQDESWVEVMHDELLQFQRNDVWTLVPRPGGEHIIGTKWIFCNKTDEEGNVIRNKALLVAQGYS